MGDSEKEIGRTVKIGKKKCLKKLPKDDSSVWLQDLSTSTNRRIVGKKR
jgi:hypothetical protein